MEMETTTEEQVANGLDVMNGTQLSDGNIGNVSHAPLQTLLCSGNGGERAAHSITHKKLIFRQL